MSSSTIKPIDGKKETKYQSDRGIKFGTEVAFDDDYVGGDGGDEYVTELPTMEEERRLLGEDVRAKEAMEELDEGRIRNHPSTLASSRTKVRLA